MRSHKEKQNIIGHQCEENECGITMTNHLGSSSINEQNIRWHAKLNHSS
jgi:hypothetical protein